MSIKKKFSWGYVKEHPFMFGTIVVVFGLLFWLLMNRNSGASGGSGSTVVSAPQQSDASIAAASNAAMAQLGSQTQIALATIDSNNQKYSIDATVALKTYEIQGQLSALNMQFQRDEDLATLEAALRANEIASNERLTSQGINAQLTSLQMQIMGQLEMQKANNSFQLDYATATFNYGMQQLNANLDYAKVVSANQLEAYKIQTIASTIPSLKKNKRDNATRDLISLVSGGAIAPTSPSSYTTGGGGLNLGSLAGIAGNLI